MHLIKKPYKMFPYKIWHVRIIGDSHLKGSAINIKQHLSSQFDVSSIIKPDAKTNQILDTQQNELKSLGKEDFLIVSTGTNDLDNPLTNINNILAPLMTFINEWKHTNIVIVDVPNRHDLGHDSVSNSKKRKIVRYNEKLYRLLNPYSHVSIVEVSSNRDHYTKHGLHLNKYGKEELAKQIAVQINSAKGLAKSVDITEPYARLDIFLLLHQTSFEVFFRRHLHFSQGSPTRYADRYSERGRKAWSLFTC